MKILISGASGFLGRHLTERLLAGGHELRLLTRRKGRVEGRFAAHERVEVFEGDLTRPEGLAGLLDGVQAVFNLAGMLGQAEIADQVYWDLNYRSTLNLLELCVGVKDKLRRFVHCSSAGVQGPIGSPPADESAPYAPSNIYETTKMEAEKAVLDCHRRHGLPAAVIRPEFVYGPKDIHVLGLFQAIAAGRFVVFGEGTSWLHPTYIDDAVQGLVLALEREAAVGEVYIVAAERAVTVRELSDEIARALGANKPRAVPLWVGRLAAVSLELLGGVLGIKVPFNRARLKFFTQNRSFDIAKAREQLGYEPRYDLARGIGETVAWYKREGYL